MFISVFCICHHTIICDYFMFVLEAIMDIIPTASTAAVKLAIKNWLSGAPGRKGGMGRKHQQQDDYSYLWSYMLMFRCIDTSVYCCII
jgi:hypothetical protein